MLEYKIFSSAFNFVFYVSAGIIFMSHACLGWKNAVTVLGIPRKDLTTRICMLLYLLNFLIGMGYISFPVYILAKSVVEEIFVLHAADAPRLSGVAKCVHSDVGHAARCVQPL